MIGDIYFEPINFLCFRFPKIFMRFTRCRKKDPTKIWCKYCHFCHTVKTFYIEEFIKKYISFEKEKRETVDFVYEQYLKYSEISNFEHDDILSRNDFLTYLFKHHGDNAGILLQGGFKPPIEVISGTCKTLVNINFVIGEANNG